MPRIVAIASQEYARNFTKQPSVVVSPGERLDRGHPRFDGIGFTRGQSGAAVIEDVLASIECRVVQSVVSGDHTIFIGEAEAANVRQDSPLLYYRGGYSQLDR